MDVLKTVDTWFLIIAVVLLAGFFVWAIQYIFSGLKESISSLDKSVKESAAKMEKLIDELFNHRNDHESRIVALETTCHMRHGADDYSGTRRSGGRRHYDPPLPIVSGD